MSDAVKTLCVREPWAKAIVSGQKTVELRRRGWTHLPERVLIYSCGKGGTKTVVGSVAIVDSRAALPSDECAAMAKIDQWGGVAWVLADPIEWVCNPKNRPYGPIWRADIDKSDCEVLFGG